MVRSRAVWGTVVVMMVSGAAQPAFAESSATARPTVRNERPAPSKALPVLYGVYGGLQLLDVASTTHATRNGAVEANPMVGSLAGSSGQFLLYKAVVSAATVAAVKKIEKKSKKAAIVTMVVLNGVTAAVVANNVKNAKR
jgi:hypothetical protein